MSDTIHKGDLVTPTSNYIGHGHIFRVTSIDIERRLCTIEIFCRNPRIVEELPNAFLNWNFLELAIIRTIESLKHEGQQKNKERLYGIAMDSCIKYFEEEKVPFYYFERDFNDMPKPQLSTITTIQDMYPNITITKVGDIEQTNKEEGEIDMLKILELYRMKEMDLIKEKHEEMRKSIIEIDEIQSIIKEMENQVKAIAGEEADAYSFDYRGLYEDRTKKALKEIDIQENRTIIDFNKKIEQIQALLELAPNYEEKIKILRDYEIMDRKKNIIL